MTESTLEESILDLIFLLAHIAFFAINRLAFCWLEWNFAFIAALRANCLMHFARPEISWFETAASVIVSHIYFLRLT